MQHNEIRAFLNESTGSLFFSAASNAWVIFSPTFALNANRQQIHTTRPAGGTFLVHYRIGI
jgi:hypothetical protein